MLGVPVTRRTITISESLGGSEITFEGEYNLTALRLQSPRLLSNKQMTQQLREMTRGALEQIGAKVVGF